MEGVFNYDANKALALKSGDDNKSGEDRVKEPRIDNEDVHRGGEYLKHEPGVRLDSKSCLRRLD